MKILAISDLHGNLPDIPPCDLLLIAGDICPDFLTKEVGQEKWFHDTFLPWVMKQPCDYMYGTWGNHDWIQHPSYNMKVDEMVEHEGVKIWFSPWCNKFGYWSWMDEPKTLVDKYAKIPEGIDILVSHQPPKGFGDKVGPIFARPGEDPHVGSNELVDTIKRVAPKVVICGHIHEGFGSYNFVHPDNTITPIMNVAHVDDRYQPTHEPQEVIL